MKNRFLAFVFVTVQISTSAFGQSASAPEIAVGGKLRCGMIAIRVLGGVAHPVCKFIADKLGVSVEPVMYSNPDAYAELWKGRVGRSYWTKGFGAGGES